MEPLNIHESDFLTMFLIPQPVRVIRNNWSSCEDMTDEEYKAEMVNMVDVLEKFTAEGMLVDTRTMRFIITPDLQEWGIPLGGRVQGAGIKKVATLISPDLFAQVSTEQYFEENDYTGMMFRFFEYEDEALNWLFGK